MATNVSERLSTLRDVLDALDEQASAATENPDFDQHEDMVERVGRFCRYNAALEKDLEDVLSGFRENTNRLVDGKQSIVKAAYRAIGHGITPPAGKNALPALSPLAPEKE